MNFPIRVYFNLTKYKNTFIDANYFVREELLESLAQEIPNRFQFHYTLDRPPNDFDWAYSTGFINKDIQWKIMF